MYPCSQLISTFLSLMWIVGCDSEYVGETEGKLNTTMKEHRTSASKCNEKSALSTHNLRTGHTFDWDHVKVVDTEPRRDWCKVTEAIHVTQECSYQPRTRTRLVTHLHALVEGGGVHSTDLYSLGMRTLCLHSQHSLMKPLVDGETLEGNQTFKLVY